MKEGRLEKFSWTIIGAVIGFLMLGGCASGPKPIESVLDSPEQHITNGFKLIKKNRLDDAMREFELSLGHRSACSSSSRGIGLIYGIKNEFRPAFEYMNKAIGCAEKKEDKAMAYVGLMRLHIMQRDKGWLGKVEDNFRAATFIINELPEGYYYMGVAYKCGYELANSEKSFRKVLEINKIFVHEAMEQIKMLKNIGQAMPSSEFEKRIGVMDQITRAEIAALFMEELSLDRIYERGSAKRKKTWFQQKGTPADIADHPLRKSIETVLQMDIEGLGVFPDGTFGPDEAITRASYAMMIADIIAMAKKDSSIAQKYAGEASPFDDVRSDAPYFSAVMTCINTGGIMQAEDGLFKPLHKVSGAEALLIIKKLKGELKIE